MKSKYSKPVLTGTNDSSYKENIKFELDIINGEDAIQSDGNIKMTIKINLTSELLKNMLLNKKARIGIKVASSLFSKFDELDYVGDEISEYFIEYDVAKLKRTDTIKCKAFIIANQDIDYNYNNELSDIYEGYVFRFHKNEILGESTEDKIDYQASGSPFIQINAIDEQNDLSFSLKDNLISINVSEDFNIAFTKLQDDSKKVCSKSILNTFLAFNAIQYSLIQTILQGVDKYCDTDWFKALDYNFDDPNYKDLKEYLGTMSGDNLEQLDIDSINKTVQQILHNQLNNKVVETWEAIK